MGMVKEAADVFFSSVPAAIWKYFWWTDSNKPFSVPVPNMPKDRRREKIKIWGKWDGDSAWPQHFSRCFILERLALCGDCCCCSSIRIPCVGFKKWDSYPPAFFVSKSWKSSQNSADEPSHLALEQTHDLSLPVCPKFFGIILENSQEMLSESWTSFFFFFWGQGEHDFILTPARCHGALPSLSLALSLVLGWHRVIVLPLPCTVVSVAFCLGCSNALCVGSVTDSTNFAVVGILALWIPKKPT